MSAFEARGGQCGRRHRRGASSNNRRLIQRLIDERSRSRDALAGGGEPFDRSSDTSFMLALPSANDRSALGTTEPFESRPRAVARPPPDVRFVHSEHALPPLPPPRDDDNGGDGASHASSRLACRSS